MVHWCGRHRVALPLLLLLLAACAGAQEAFVHSFISDVQRAPTRRLLATTTVHPGCTGWSLMGAGLCDLFRA